MINDFLELNYKSLNDSLIELDGKQLSKINIVIDFESSDFAKALEAISKSSFYKKTTPELGNQHKIGHIQKVMLFSQIIAQNENLTSSQIKILLASAAFHDSGRTRDRDNGVHGVLSAEIAGEYFKKNPNNPYGITAEEIGIIQASIAYHVISEDILGQIDEDKLNITCYKYRVRLSDFERVKQVSAILKDADALDRARFISGSSLDTRMLRTSTAKRTIIIEIAKKINEEYAAHVLSQNYSIKPSNNNLEELHYARRNYKRDHGGLPKDEIDVPVRTIKLIFRDVLDKIIKENEKCVSDCKEELEL